MAAADQARPRPHTALNISTDGAGHQDAGTLASGLVCEPASGTEQELVQSGERAAASKELLKQDVQPGRSRRSSTKDLDASVQTAHSTCPKSKAVWPRVVQAMKGYQKNVRNNPMLMLLPPLLLFAVCVGLGVYGVMAGAHKEMADKKSVVTGSATDWAASFKLSLEKSFAPLTTLAIMVKQQPNYTEFVSSFPSVAYDLLDMVGRSSIYELQISPMGIISTIYPPDGLAVKGRLYGDIFAEPALRGGALSTVQQRRLVLNGPLFLINGDFFGAIARTPIFIQNSTANETFGTNKTLPTDCTDLCWNPETREKFWGFVTAILPLMDLRAGNDSRLDILKQKGYNWKMTRPYTSTEVNPNNDADYVFANSSCMPEDPVSVQVEVSNAVWTIYVAPENGWVPSWRNGMLVLVVLGSTVLALLVGLIFASWAEQKALLGEVLASNAALETTTKHLEDEKLRLDALLVRQYNLISVLGGQGQSRKPAAAGGAGGGGGGGPDKSGGDGTDSPLGSVLGSGSKEGLTLDRIETMRRQLAVSTLSSSADIDSIQTVELLGEGTFGKVYKGLWRGTVVAVKTMMLPANMSGAEKREKMAVMEAAISSSLSHPNIVQTYTYAIRPIKDQGATPEMPDPELLVVAPMSTITQGIKSHSKECTTTNTSTAAGSVHSYEVRLVLEFCDKGCLRDALDSSSLLTEDGSVNYPAVLDLAADTAKAMLHLHSLNVLHADLKARNIMLKGDGQGVVAKVADFGLSLKMDHTETHLSNVYQGTMTHMAPEILLEGHVSKGADVYAFGITLWELYTGGHPFKGVPRALLGHQVAREALRPRFPPTTPPAYKQLAERCWHHIPEMRPTFSEVLDELLKLRAAEPQLIAPLHIKPPVRRPVGSEHGTPLPACAGMSTSAPNGGSMPLQYDSTSGVGKHEWAHASTVRQRPLMLPKIQEGYQEDNEDEEHGDAAAQADLGRASSAASCDGQGTPCAASGTMPASKRTPAGSRTSLNSARTRPTFSPQTGTPAVEALHSSALSAMPGPHLPSLASTNVLLHMHGSPEEEAVHTGSTEVPSGIEVMDASLADSTWR